MSAPAATSGRPLARPISFLWRHREGISTLLMGMAAVVTAWCAFEAAKWSGIQSIRFAQAAAARTESSRNDLIDHQIAQIDVASFLAWIEALQAEAGGALIKETGSYTPDPTMTSGFLYHRFRPEFREAVEAWIATRPLRNADAPPTPFAMEAYQRPLGQRAAVLVKQADHHVEAGRQANRNSDNYTLVTVFSSMSIFFAGLSSKLVLRVNGLGLLLLALVSFLVCVIALFTLPVVVF